MRASLRVKMMLAAGILALGPSAALAQAAPPPTTNTSTTDAVGPSELQNFSLKGTVTRPADQPAVAAPARTQTAPVRPPALTGPSSTASSQRRVEHAAPTSPPSPSTPARQPSTIAKAAPAPAASPPSPVESAPGPSVPAPNITVPSSSLPLAPEPAEPSRSLPLWPWIAAALAFAAAAGFLLWRRSQRGMAVAGPQFDLLVPTAPEPEPQQRARTSAPAPPASPQQPLPSPPTRPVAASGIVASRLRPSLELGFHPLRCQVDDDQVAIEFELELFNTGAAPARAVLAEASLLNAGSTQEHDLSAFFANPNGVGDRLDVIPPMKRISLRSQVVAPRAAVQEYELAGRKAFVPVIAFNALYEWSGGKGQSSAAYLVGRDTQQDKLGPLRLDQGAREFRGLGARPLPSGVRT